MIDFLNNNSSAVFSVITLVFTLTIPFLTKRSELRYQAKLDRYKESKTVYKDLIYNFGCFYTALQRLYGLIENENTDLSEETIRQILRSLIDYHTKASHIFNTSIAIDTKLIESISVCLSNQNGTIELLKTLDYKDLINILVPLLNALERYRSNYFEVRKIINEL
ncbi:MAG: hypothetical protein RBQ97_07795 [Acholeplasma sp.]|nr:hypothetical protein [Acholeplasma sp.]